MGNILLGSLGLSLLIAEKHAVCLFYSSCLHFDVLKIYPHSSLSNLKTDLHLPLVPTVESKLLNSFHEYILIKGQDLLALLFFVFVFWPHYMACGILIAYGELCQTRLDHSRAFV